MLFRSGPGLVALHQALAALQGMTTAPGITAAQITQAALQAHDPLSLQTLETFTAFLGTVAGDLALTLGARGGVYLGGGILPHWRGWLAQSPFRARFEAKGRYRDYMAAIPVWWIDAPTSPALLGAARALAFLPMDAWAPGRFSITTRVLSHCVIPGATCRTTTSLEPPGAKPATMRTGLQGQCCSLAPRDIAASTVVVMPCQSNLFINL